MGADFWLGTTLVRVVRVAGPDKLLVRHLATQRPEHVGSGALRAIEPDFDPEATETYPIAVETYSAADWERARDVQTTVRALESRRTPSRAAEMRAAKELGVSSRHLRRWRVRYRTLGTLEAFLPRRASRKSGTRLLGPRLEQLIDEEVRSALKRSADVAINDLYPLICASARAVRVRAPARSTVARRLASLKRDTANFAPETARALTEKRLPVHGSLKTTGALSVVQIDHTLADVILVDPLEHRPIGRPWMTLALDVHTRTILGMLLSLEAPSSLSVALALDHAVFPKQAWADSLGVEPEGWLGFGIPAGARRMVESAALLVDEVLPGVPMRQWVLSVPFALRFLFASNAAAMGEALRIVYRTISGFMIHKAELTRTTGQSGAVTLVQRFGSALNLNVHFHMLIPDGVYLTCRISSVGDHPVSSVEDHLIS